MGRQFRCLRLVAKPYSRIFQFVNVFPVAKLIEISRKSDISWRLSLEIPSSTRPQQHRIAMELKKMPLTFRE